MPAFVTTLPVRFGDIDHARILYYPAFYHYCHQAFEDLWPELMGVPYAHVLDHDKVGFPAVHQEMDFKSPVRYGESLRVTITCERIGNKSFQVRFEIDDAATRTLRAVCRMTLAVLDMSTYTSMPLPSAYRAIFEGIMEPSA